MLRKTCFVGAVAAGAGLLVSAPAMADTGGDDGVNIGDDNNVQLLPVQLCDANVIGKVVNQESPDEVDCSNAPMVDHPKTEVHHHAPAPQAKPPQGAPRQHAAQPAKTQPRKAQPAKVQHAKPHHRTAAKQSLPTAPSAAPVPGHAPVTG